MLLTLDQLRANYAAPKRGPWDVSEDRKPVEQTRPGKHISSLAGIHAGRCAVLFNGSSLALHDLHAIKVPLVGMNRTFVGYKDYTGPQPDYYCFVDMYWKETARELDKAGVVVVNGSTDRAEIGVRATRGKRMSPFSLDLARDGYVDPIPCTTGHLALQLAAYLGFTEIHCLGLDMGGPHFNGTRSSLFMESANAYHRKQAVVLERAGIKVFVTGSPESRCTAFPHVPFSRLFEES